MRGAVAIILTLGLAVAGSACGSTVEYTETNAPSVEASSRRPEDVEVFTTQVPADRSYEEVGIIEARQASPVSGDGQSEIIAELRASAAERGCHGIIITGSANEVVGSVSDGSGSVGTLKGYRATCIMFTGTASKGAATTVGAAPEAEGGPASPTGVAGFEFAMTTAAARSACEAAGHTWTEKAKVAACSGPAENVGVSGTVQLLPCHDAFCQILVTSEPDEGELISTVTGLKQAIEKRYGAPATANTAVPQDCRETIAECVDQQRAYLEYIWTFENGHSVKLRLGKRPDEAGAASGADHKLRLLYTRRVPAKMRAEDSSLAL